MIEGLSIDMPNIGVSNEIIGAIFLAFFLGVIIMSWILTYHWKNFGFRSPYIHKARSIYLSGIFSILLVAIIVLFIIFSLK